MDIGRPRSIFSDAQRLRLKGASVYRPNSIRGEELSTVRRPNAGYACAGSCDCL